MTIRAGFPKRLALDTVTPVTLDGTIQKKDGNHTTDTYNVLQHVKCIRQKNSLVLLSQVVQLIYVALNGTCHCMSSRKL